MPSLPQEYDPNSILSLINAAENRLLAALNSKQVLPETKSIETVADRQTRENEIFIHRRQSDGKVFLVIRRDGKAHTLETSQTAINQQAISLIKSKFAGMQNGDSATNIYEVPQGKSLYITHVVVRDPTGSLAGGTDFDFGSFKTAVDLSGMTNTSHYYVVQSDNSALTKLAGGATFTLTVNTGATADVDATIDVFGYLVIE